MATIPSPTTFTVGQKLTAALMNSNVRDSVNFFASSPLCVVTNSAAQSLVNNANNAILFDTEAVDSDNMHSTVTNTSRITAVTAGYYNVTGHVPYVFNATGERHVWFSINGSLTRIAYSTALAMTTTGHITSVTAATTLFLNVGDYVELYGYQNTGGVLNTDISTGSPRLSALWVHS